MKKTILLLTATLLLHTAFAQSEKCATAKAWTLLKTKDANAQARMEQMEEFTKNYHAQNPVLNYKVNNTANASRSQRSVIMIPVVVHVIYHNEQLGVGANISDAQIHSQIDALNADFRLLNADSIPTSHPFWNYSADCMIQFCLAKQEPNGNPTNGIVRINSSVTSFSEQDFFDDVMKFTSTGGDDNWNPEHYLNFWTFRIDATSGMLGKSSFPSNLATNPELDGVICRFDAFGTTGPLRPANTLGRTMTHEVGHWFNLKHIWGDDDGATQNLACDLGECDGSDGVDDTPNQCERNYGCPSFPNNPYNDCGSDENGDMYMDYMDYTDDPCMVMFTFGQAERMQAALAGPRAEIRNSNGCQMSTGVADIYADKNIEVSPNPSSGNFNIRFKQGTGEMISKLSVSNSLGMTVANIELDNSDNYQLNLSNQPSGIYFLQAVEKGKTISKKLILN
ncbi:MAG: M43 family zinc metalloprotease [Bacteroidetes bacterium]|nr:M43 family zinc metalloprotease [Bacteroidota bacterium]